LTLQLADAKYEALKSQQFLADKICECCCDVKQKIDRADCNIKEKVDLIDRDRLRDNLTVSNNDNNLLKILEFTQAFGHGYGYGGYGRGRRHSRSRSRSRDRRDDRR
jgi:hypothetical protein